MNKEKLNQIPKSPGIYKYFDKTGKIIYIGKSINLFSRVNSYFNNKTKLNFAKENMVKQIEKIETIITNNEIESLILESTLIKKHLPKYNTLMKDGKNHLYIKITNEDYPKILKTRIKNNSGIYFGPYINTNHVNNILKTIKKYFGYGIENHNFFGNSKNYNLDKYLFKNDINGKKSCIYEEYNNQIENIKYFLKGNHKNIIKNLEIKMFNYAKELKFEKANNIKQNIEAVKSLNIEQNVKDKVNGNFNIINYIEKFDSFHIGLTEIIDSKIVGYNNFEIIYKLGESKEDIIENFILNNIIKYLKQKSKPIYILPLKINNTLINNLGIKIEIPQIGPKLELLKLTYKNIYEHAYKKHLDFLSTKGFTKNNMKKILNILGYKEINKDIIFECNDISHLSGNNTVASRSIIENGKCNTSKYKKFNIKTLEEGKIDDFGSMEEIMKRRLKEIEKNGIIPDLIIIDGGKGQLSSVIKILGEKLQIVSIAKREEELFLPGKKESIILEKDSLELRLIQKIRDEAHRFAITFNRDKRIKQMKKNILDSLPGFGLKTRKKILNKYGNIEKLFGISEEELNKILNKTQIEVLKDHGII